MVRQRLLVACFDLLDIWLASSVLISSRSKLLVVSHRRLPVAPADATAIIWAGLQLVSLVSHRSSPVHALITRVS